MSPCGLDGKQMLLDHKQLGFPNSLSFRRLVPNYPISTNDTDLGNSFRSSPRYRRCRSGGRFAGTRLRGRNTMSSMIFDMDLFSKADRRCLGHEQMCSGRDVQRVSSLARSVSSTGFEKRFDKTSTTPLVTTTASNRPGLVLHQIHCRTQIPHSTMLRSGSRPWCRRKRFCQTPTRSS